MFMGVLGWLELVFCMVFMVRVWIVLVIGLKMEGEMVGVVDMGGFWIDSVKVLNYW